MYTAFNNAVKLMLRRKCKAFFETNKTKLFPKKSFYFSTPCDSGFQVHTFSKAFKVAERNKKVFAENEITPIFALPINERPVRLSARTSPFHGGKTGSIPVPATGKGKS